MPQGPRWGFATNSVGSFHPRPPVRAPLPDPLEGRGGCKGARKGKNGSLGAEPPASHLRRSRSGSGAEPPASFLRQSRNQGLGGRAPSNRNLICFCIGKQYSLDLTMIRSLSSAYVEGPGGRKRKKSFLGISAWSLLFQIKSFESRRVVFSQTAHKLKFSLVRVEFRVKIALEV